MTAPTGMRIGWIAACLAVVALAVLGWMTPSLIRGDPATTPAPQPRTHPAAPPAGPSAELGVLSGLVAQLNRARATDEAALRSARDPGAQAAAAARLARAHEQASRRLAALGPDADPSLVRALDDATAAYRAIVRAARAEHPARFARAAARAGSVDRVVQRRLLVQARRSA